LYADDIVILSESETGLQNGLDLLECYCDRWKLKVNISKTKAMLFKKGGRNCLHINMRSYKSLTF